MEFVFSMFCTAAGATNYSDCRRKGEFALLLRRANASAGISNYLKDSF
jgi:hypothetical protein